MELNNLESVAAVVFAGSLVMERFVTIVKTFFPKQFGDPGPNPEAIYERAARNPREEVKVTRKYTLLEMEARKARVVLLVVGASMLTAILIGESRPCAGMFTDRCLEVKYTPNLSMPWYVFAFLISGGSAFWAQIIGVVSAMKDVRVEQQKDRSATVYVVDKNDAPRFETGNTPADPE